MGNVLEKREVVCDFEGRRRPVLFCTSEDVKEENKNLLAAVKSTFCDVLSSKEDDAYFLQIESKKHGAIDVIGSSVHVADNDTVYLRYWKHPEDDVSRQSDREMRVIEFTCKFCVGQQV